MRQCQLLDIARSTVYYRPQAVNDIDDELMKRIDAVHLERPLLGSRRIGDALADEGLIFNRKRVQRLMRIMGLTALYPKPRTTKPAPGHRIYPYLLRDLSPIQHRSVAAYAHLKSLQAAAPVNWPRGETEHIR